jgi:hydrogenase maturation factor
VSVNECGDHCITCSDEGIPMQVERIDGARGLALCAAEDGSKSTVEIALVSVRPGDRVLVHAGVALAELSAQ